jgi:DNA-binding beta-propeller fold protein YncE
MRNYVPFCAPQLVTEINTGPRPHGVAVDAAGHRAFVAHADGVAVIDTDSYTVITETGTPAGAYNVAYDHDQNRIWVTRMDAGRVTVLDGVTYSPLADLPASDGPLDIAYNPTNERVYASSFLGNRVNVYNAVDMEREQTLKDFEEPSQIAVNPITNKIYVINHVNNAQMTVIDGETHETYRVATGLLDGYGVVVDTTRNLIYATSIYEGRLVIIDGETEEGLGKIEFRRSDGRKPPLRFLAVNPDVGPEGHLFLITSSVDKGEDQLLLIPNGWPSLGTPVPLDIARYPVEGIAFNPETDRVWVTSVESGVVSVIQDGLPVCSYPF